MSPRLPAGKLSTCEPPARADGEGTLVHLEGAEDGVVLQWADPSTGTWRTACHGSCDVVLPADILYRIGGRDVKPSAPFKVGGARVSYRVQAASPAAFAAGAVLAVLGGLGAAGGFAAGLAMSASSRGAGAGIFGSDFGSNIGLAFGVVLGAVGMACSVGGVALLGMNSTTTVTRVDGTPPVHAAIPAWREQAPSPSPVRSAMFGIPLLSGTF